MTQRLRCISITINLRSSGIHGENQYEKERKGKIIRSEIDDRNRNIEIAIHINGSITVRPKGKRERDGEEKKMERTKTQKKKIWFSLNAQSEF